METPVRPVQSVRWRTCLRRLTLAGALGSLAVACVLSGPGNPEIHLWWAGFGPVLPHDTFPGDCSLCHVGEGWETLREDFQFDHEAETGVPLHGAHAFATCLRCHNDRGPVSEFANQGCAGCHEDVHQGQLGPDCKACHEERTWRAVGMFELHYQTRFPLVGVHASTACYRCHPGAEVGKFTPTDTECVTCHRDDLAQALNPNHINANLVDNCDRCHIPTTWYQTD